MIQINKLNKTTCLFYKEKIKTLFKLRTNVLVLVFVLFPCEEFGVSTLLRVPWGTQGRYHWKENYRNYNYTLFTRLHIRRFSAFSNSRFWRTYTSLNVPLFIFISSIKNITCFGVVYQLKLLIT